MGASVGQQGAGRGTILAVLGLLAAATTGYFFAVPGGSTGGIIFKEGTAAGSPAAGERVVYAKTTGIYEKNSAGTESQLGAGTQGGTTGSLTNAIVRATSANTLADTSLTESSGTVTGSSDVAVKFKAGAASSSSNGANATLEAAAGKASSNGNGGNVYLIPGDKDGSGTGGICYVNGSLELSPTVGNYQATPTMGLKSPASNTIDVYANGTTGWGWTNQTSYPGIVLHSSSSQLYFSAAGSSSGAKDAGLGRAAAGVVSVTDGSTGLGWLQDSGRDYATADQTVDSTTLTADDTISLTLKAGRKYKFTLIYFFTPGDTVADGLKFDMAGGTATMTGFEARVRVVDNVGQDVSVTNSRMTALNTAVSLTGNQPATSFTMYVDGFAEVNAAGTLIPEFAKSADAGTGVVKKKYSQIEALDYP